MNHSTSRALSSSAPRSLRRTTALFLLLGAWVASFAAAADGDLDTTFWSDGTLGLPVAVYPGPMAVTFDAEGHTVIGFTEGSAPPQLGLVTYVLWDDSTGSQNGGTVCPLGTTLSGDGESRFVDLALWGNRLYVAATFDPASAGPNEQVLLAHALGELETEGCLADGSFTFGGELVSQDTRQPVALAAAPNGDVWLALAADPGGMQTMRISSEAVPFLDFQADYLDFSALGATSFEPTDMVRQPDGKLVIVGNVSYAGGDVDVGVVRVNADAAASLDTGFSGDGLATFHFGFLSDPGVDEARAVALTADGRVVIGGTTQASVGTYATVAILTQSGVLDVSFGLFGKQLLDFGNSNGLNFINDLAVGLDGRIVVVGAAGPNVLLSNYDFAVARLASRGGSPLDATFGNGGVVKIALDNGGANADVARAVSLDLPGTITVLGTEQAGAVYIPAIVRLTHSGIFADGFESGNTIVWSGALGL